MKKSRLFVLFGGFFFVWVVASLPFMLAHAKPSPKPTLPKRLTFATLAVGTLFHVTASGLAKVATENSPMTLAVSPMASGRSWAYQMNKRGKPEVGIFQISEIWQAYTGKLAPEPEPIPGDPRKGPPYKPASPNLRVLLVGNYLRVGSLVRADSPMKTLNDMRGKRMTWGFPAFPPCIEIGLAALRAAKMTINDVAPVPVTEVISGMRALMERRVDIACAAVGMPMVGEANSRIGVRFLHYPKDAEAVKRHQTIMPGTSIRAVPPGLPGLKVPTPMTHAPIAIQTSNHLPDHVAYELVKVWWNHYKKLAPIHPQFRGWTPELYVSKLATVPYHSGAIKFYKEKGVWKAEQDKMQKRLLKGELPFLD